MSAFQTLLGIPGAAARRSPVRRSPGSAPFHKVSSVVYRLRYLIPPAIALAVVIAIQLGGALNAPSTATDKSLPDAGDLSPITEISSIGAVDTSDVDRRIEFWRARTVAHPQSEGEWIALGDLFDLKGRMTGDVAQYVSAQTAYQQAIQVAPNSSAAHSGNARVMSTLHDFTGALVEATKTLVLDPSATAALGVVFDASLELGHLDQAQQALDVLSQRSESPSIATRQARLDFLRGDTASAVALAETAASDASDRADLPSSVAFYNYTAAEYELLAGNLDAADAHYSTALTLLPGYPLAIYGRARVDFARGDIAGATALATTATAALPRPDMLAFLGDLYALTGDSAKATDQYATVDFIASMTSSSGGRVYDREYGLYLSDHGTNVTHALELAQNEFALRKDVYGYDALAWALHANGRDAEALTQIQQALSLGTVDAKLLLHAGLIELANGQMDAGRAHLSQALALNPAVSPLVVDAARKAVGR